MWLHRKQSNLLPSIQLRSAHHQSTLVIRNLVLLEIWRQQLRNIIWSHNLPTVEFQLLELSCEQNQSLSALACSLQKACGCTSSGLFMSITAVTIATSHFTSGNYLSNMNCLHIISFVGITIFAALLGKLLGLFWARWRLLRLVVSIHKTIIRINNEQFLKQNK